MDAPAHLLSPARLVKDASLAIVHSVVTTHRLEVYAVLSLPTCQAVSATKVTRSSSQH